MVSLAPSITMIIRGTSLIVQQLRLLASNAAGAGLNPGQGTNPMYHETKSKLKKKMKGFHFFKTLKK